MFTLQIFDDLQFFAYHCGVKCTISTLSQNRIHKFCRWSEIDEAVRFLNTIDSDSKKVIIAQQMAAMAKKNIGEKKYDTSTIVRAFEYFALSRSAYSRLRQDFALPSIRTLTRLTSKVRNTDDATYIAKIFTQLTDPRQKNCVLIVDEVYVKSMLQYHGGIVFGKAVNNPEKLANTVLSFMIVCLCAGPKFLCKILPVKNLDASFLFDQATILIDAVKKAGGKVVVVVGDGNRVNKKFFKKFDTIDDEPWRTKDDMFLLFDYVHLLKAVRNNWITEKTQELEFSTNGNKKVAKWEHIVQLYRSEITQLAKMSKLSEVSVRPKPIERQKVSTCLQVFCEETISALKVHPELRDCADMIEFLLVMVEWWKIVDVHNPFTDQRLRDPYRAVIRSADHPNLEKLLQIGKMASAMNNTGPRKKSLTIDTSESFSHTCNGLVALSKHLLQYQDYVMLGDFTSDPIEKEFGKLRQGSGGTYFITVQQIFEKVGIRKTKTLLKMAGSDVLEDTVSGHNCCKCRFQLPEDLCDVLDNLPELEKCLDGDTMNSLFLYSKLYC